MSAPRFRAKPSSGCNRRNNCNIRKELYTMTAGERIQRNMSAEYCKDVCEYNVLMNQIESQFNTLKGEFKFLSDYDHATDDSLLEGLKTKLNTQRTAKNLEGMLSVLNEMTNLYISKVVIIPGVVGGGGSLP